MKRSGRRAKLPPKKRSARPRGDLCPICEKGRLRPGKVRYEYAGIHYGDYEGEVCDVCGEGFLTQASSDAIETKAKALGHWGIAKRSKVGTSGHSLSVRIPKELERELCIRKGDAITIRPEGRNRIVIDLESGAEA